MAAENEMVHFVKGSYLRCNDSNRDKLRSRKATEDECLDFSDNSHRRFSLASLCPFVLLRETREPYEEMHAPCHWTLKSNDFDKCVNVVQITANKFRGVEENLYTKRLVEDSFLSPTYRIVDVGCTDLNKTVLLESVMYTKPTDLAKKVKNGFHIMANVLVRQAWEFPWVSDTFEKAVNEWGATTDTALFLSQTMSSDGCIKPRQGHLAVYSGDCPAASVGAILIHGYRAIKDGLMPEYSYKELYLTDISSAFGSGYMTGLTLCEAVKKTINRRTRWVLPYATPLDYEPRSKPDKIPVDIDAFVNICCEEYTKSFGKKEI